MSENIVKPKETEEIGQGNSVAPIPQPTPSKGWIKFDDDAPPSQSTDLKSNAHPEDSPAVIKTESVQVNLERSLTKSLDNANVAVLDPKPLRNVELPIATVEPIVQGFSRSVYFLDKSHI